MASHSDHTLGEILSQPASWASALEAVRAHADAIQALLGRFADRPLLLSGCGSPYYLSLSAAALMRAHARRACLAAPASELIFEPATVMADDDAPLLILFSRSGETSEVIAAARANLGAWLMLILVVILAGFVGSLGLIACGIGALFTSFYAQCVIGHSLGQTVAQLGMMGGTSEPPIPPPMYQ